MPVALIVIPNGADTGVQRSMKNEVDNDTLFLQYCNLAKLLIDQESDFKLFFFFFIFIHHHTWLYVIVKRIFTELFMLEKKIKITFN